MLNFARGDRACEAAENAVGSAVTFNRDVAPILFAKCSGCHHAGEAAPFELLTFEDVRDRGKQIAEVTHTRFMPPWLPQPNANAFLGERRLTDQELEILQNWVQQGMPRGQERDLPKSPEYTAGWQLGPPDLILESPPYQLASEGTDQFRNFVIPVEVSSPHWIRSLELRPLNLKVTHHARLGVDTTNESLRRDAEDSQPGYDGMAWGQDPDGQLIAWAPGMMAREGITGAAWRLQPNSFFVLHSHLQPSGKPETVQFRIGIYFSKEPPSIQPAILRIGSRDIDIPPDVTRHTVVDHYRLPIDLDVYSIFPHAHSLCQEIRVHVIVPGDNAETTIPLIEISHFDENWHDNYRYAQPIRLPRGTQVITECVYDNSAANIRNRHNPPRRVVYGSNVDDEMSDVYLQVTPTRPDERAVLMEDYANYEAQSKLQGYRKTLEQYPQDPWSREGMAACYVTLAEPGKAVSVLEELEKLTPDSLHAIASLGMACYLNGEPIRAEKLLRRAVAMDAQHPLAWLGLGQTLNAQKKFAEALRAYETAIKLAPGLVDAQLNRADILLRQGDLEGAAAGCENAIQQTPDEPKSYLKLAEIRAKEQRYDDCLRLLQQAAVHAPYTHPPKVLLAVFLFQNGQSDRAQELLKEAHAELPNHPVPNLFLGQYALRSGHFAEARTYLESAAAKAIPDNWPASHRQRFLVLVHSERLRLAQQLQDLKLAQSAVSEWLKLEPANSRVKQLERELESQSRSPAGSR